MNVPVKPTTKKPATPPAHSDVPAVPAPEPTVLVFLGGPGFPDERAVARLQALRAKYPMRKPRKGSKGAAQLVRELRDGGG